MVVPEGVAEMALEPVLQANSARPGKLVKTGLPTRGHLRHWQTRQSSRPRGGKGRHSRFPDGNSTGSFQCPVLSRLCHVV